ncbi:hypothetical protein [Paenibacillus albidus]|nr:hypothetical protein [Paenibacillus albidus]
MAQIHEEIIINAPVALCFDTARTMELHPRTVWPHTRERLVAGRVR